MARLRKGIPGRPAHRRHWDTICTFCLEAYMMYGKTDVPINLDPPYRYGKPADLNQHLSKKHDGHQCDRDKQQAIYALFRSTYPQYKENKDGEDEDLGHGHGEPEEEGDDEEDARVDEQSEVTPSTKTKRRKIAVSIASTTPTRPAATEPLSEYEEQSGRSNALIVSGTPGTTQVGYQYGQYPSSGGVLQNPQGRGSQIHFPNPYPVYDPFQTPLPSNTQVLPPTPDSQLSGIHTTRTGGTVQFRVVGEGRAQDLVFRCGGCDVWKEINLRRVLSCGDSICTKCTEKYADQCPTCGEVRLGKAVRVIEELKFKGKN